MNRIVGTMGLLILGSGFALPAGAAGASGDEALHMQIFGHPLGTEKAHACFRRAYDAPHLAGHPKQNVRTMTLLITGDVSNPDSPAYSIGLDVKFRKDGTHFETYGGCGSVGADSADENMNVVGCGVDCDGGEIDVKLKSDRTVLVSIPDGARLWDPNSDSDDQPDSGRGKFGADDKLFRLDRTGLTDCLSLASDDDEKAAMQNER